MAELVWVDYRLLASVSLPSMLNILPPQLHVAHRAPGSWRQGLSLPLFLDVQALPTLWRGRAWTSLGKSCKWRQQSNLPAPLVRELSPVEGEQGQV